MHCIIYHQYRDPEKGSATIRQEATTIIPLMTTVGHYYGVLAHRLGFKSSSFFFLFLLGFLFYQHFYGGSEEEPTSAPLPIFILLCMCATVVYPPGLLHDRRAPIENFCITLRDRERELLEPDYSVRRLK